MRARLGVEVLEDRTLLAAPVTAYWLGAVSANLANRDRGGIVIGARAHTQLRITPTDA